MLKSKPALPFSLEQIKTIRWIPGEQTCLVSYAPEDGIPARRVKKVGLDEMAVIRPDFERMLACAFVCNADVVRPGAAIAHLIRRWSSLLDVASASDYALSRAQIRKWGDVRDVRLGVTRQNMGNQFLDAQENYCTLRWPNGSLGYFTYPVIEANSPGLIDWVAILCEEYAVPSVEAFKLRRQLEGALSYAMLRDHHGSMSTQLRACMSVGMELGNLVSLLVESANKPPCDVPLPSLMENPSA